VADLSIPCELFSCMTINIFMTYEFEFTPQKLQACMPHNPRVTEWFRIIHDTLPQYNITTWRRVAQWLAQTGQESGDFRSLTENLNYSSEGLRRIWPRHFPTAQIADQYHRQPERIANRAYANRIGNGPESSGDGWKFRGRGLIQVTGRANYAEASVAMYGDAQVLLDEPELLVEPDGAVRSACWFWNSRRLNAHADREDTLTVTKIINGGTHGLAERQERYARASRVLRS
jgi:putative chitinase